MKIADLDKKTFYSYCLYTQRQRGYKSNWAFVMVKSQFGEWVDKKMKAETEAQQPTENFLKWLDEYQSNYMKQRKEENKTREQAELAKPPKPKPRKPPKHDVERQMREIGEKLAKEGKDFTNVSDERLKSEMQAWHINEYHKKKLAKMTEQEQLIDLFFI